MEHRRGPGHRRPRRAGLVRVGYYRRRRVRLFLLRTAVFEVTEFFGGNGFNTEARSHGGRTEAVRLVGVRSTPTPVTRGNADTNRLGAQVRLVSAFPHVTASRLRRP